MSEPNQVECPLTGEMVDMAVCLQHAACIESRKSDSMVAPLIPPEPPSAEEQADKHRAVLENLRLRKDRTAILHRLFGLQSYADRVLYLNKIKDKPELKDRLAAAAELWWEEMGKKQT